MLFDLASLTKPLVTAPLAFEHLDLDRDWAPTLGFVDWLGPITPRLLLSHAAGLPPWLPFTGESMAEQIAAFTGWGGHPLLKRATWGESTYSDLGYRALGVILEMETGQYWSVLGERLTGLSPAPWRESTVAMPPGADLAAWALSTTDPFPEPQPGCPHDANARAGMVGHAGFGATPQQARAWLGTWFQRYAPLMAVETGLSQNGEVWGLGLQRLREGDGGFAPLLEGLGSGGIHVISDSGSDEPPRQTWSPADPPGGFSDWWFHLGYTGPALFVSPRRSLCVLILCHRLSDGSGLLGIDALKARRWQALKNYLQ